jgi:hypothetical protein
MRSTGGWPHWAGSRRERLSRGKELARLIERSADPEKVEQGWKQMREDRAGFVAFFGADGLILQPSEAGTIGIIFDDVDGLLAEVGGAADDAEGIWG